jgi:hypothetical protein
LSWAGRAAANLDVTLLALPFGAGDLYAREVFKDELDESGEDYLFPEGLFVSIDVPAKAAAASATPTPTSR